MSFPPVERALATRALPRRLEALLALVGSVELLADVGTDHALLPAHAVMRGQCGRALAMDLRELPLQAARQMLSLLGVSHRVQLVRADGFSVLARMPVDALVMAGLSGRSMMSWCQAAPKVVERVQRLILQPNDRLPALRAWAYGAGLWLLDENICEERGRFFVSCAFVKRDGSDPAYRGLEVSLEHAFELGPWLLRRRVREAGVHYARELARIEGLRAAGISAYGTEQAAFASACRLFSR